MKRSRTAALTALVLVGLGAGCASTPTAPPGAPAAAAVAPVRAAVPDGECTGYVALTFDDGPTPLTGDLLAALSRERVPATFFNVGEQEQLFPGYVEQQAAQGHQFGNHSWDHTDLLTLRPAETADQLRRAKEQHAAITGDEPYLFRPPYGSTSAAVRAEAAKQDMAEVMWTADSKDFETPSAAQVAENSKGMRDGGVLLLHDGKPQTIEALPAIVAHYRGQGLCFGRIAPSEDAPQRGDGGGLFYARAVRPA